MGVKLQLILGAILILKICSSTCNKTISQNVSSDGIENNSNLIEKLPKTDAALNIVSKDTQENTGDTSNSDLGDQDDDTTKSITNNEVEKEIEKVMQIPDGKSRVNGTRSINIQKFISPKFQNIAHTHSISSGNEKHLDATIHKSTTQEFHDFSKFELSTPKTDFFDKKFSEAKQKLEQDYESNGYGNFDYDNSENQNHGDGELEEETEGDFRLDKLFEEFVDNPNSSLDFKEQTNISKSDEADKNSKHSDITVEKRKLVRFLTNFASTSTYSKKGDDDTKTIETTFPKTVTRTTGKSVRLTKPPTNNNSHILSNKIESETIKAIYPAIAEISTKASSEDNELVPKEQTVEENKVNILNITAPEIITVATSTTLENYSTTKNDVTTISQSESTSMHEDFNSFDDTTTTTEESTIISTVSFEESTTGNTVFLTSTENQNMGNETPYTVDLRNTEDVTTSGKLLAQRPVTSEDRTESTTTEDVVTDSDTVTTSISTESKSSAAWYEMKDQQTTIMEEGTTIMTEMELTENIARVSKQLAFEETTGIEVISTTATDTATESVTEPVNLRSGITVTTYSSTEFKITPDTTEIPTTTLSPSITETTFVPTMKIPTSESSTTSEITVTTVEFIHVETRDNHTTLLPETLSPNLNYPTTIDEKKIKSVTDVTGDSEQTSIDLSTTEEDTIGTSAGTDHSIIDASEDSKGKIAAIVISCVGAVCLVLLAGLLYLMRKRQRRFNYKQRCRPVNLDDYSVDNVSVYNSVRRKADRQSKRSYGNPAFEDPSGVTHPLNFPALAKFAVNTDDIKAEFEEIPQITAKTSELPEGCEPKNRYANVIPLPETRVFLKAIEGYPNSDYINANFVTGPKNTKSYYIACQAPMQNTVDDFWRMIWEQQSKVILMITHFFENGVEKCFDYLPPSEVLDCNRLFGDFQVTLKKRDVKEKYIISSLQLKNMVSNSWREVTHFWYLGWPEKGVPAEANSLIAFLIEARSYMKSSTLDKNAVTDGNLNGAVPNEVNPVVVHCSPGTGRTGVVVACDISIREFEQTRLVDIPKIVYRIRRDRASAVQTKEQYMFIYKVVSLYATKLSGGGFETF